MKAILVKNTHLTIEEVPEPEPKLQEILVHVEAIGVNYADVLQSEGKYPPPHGVSDIIGLEVAGTVVSLGPHCTRFQKGDRVMCLLAGGGYAETVCVHQSHCLLIPPNLSFEQAAAIPEAFLTAYQALFMIGELQSEQWVLIHAAGSGVGTAALQLARCMDSKTIVTSRTEEKLEKCLELGAMAVINTSDGAFAPKVLEITEGHGVELIIDFIGAPYLAQNIEALAMGGAIIFLATLGGAVQKAFNLGLLLKKWATLSGTTLRNRTVEYKAKLVEEFNHFALDRFESGLLKPVIHAVFPWKEVKRAHEELKQNRAFGKLILVP